MSFSPSIRRTSSGNTTSSTKSHQPTPAPPPVPTLNNSHFPPPSSTANTATLGHLPRKPSAHPNPRHTPLVGVLNSSAGAHPASPNATGFGKGGQGFGRVGIDPPPALSSTTPAQPYFLEKQRKKNSLNITSSPVPAGANGTVVSIPKPAPSPAGASPHRARRLGSFNSLAVSLNPPSTSKEMTKQSEDRTAPVRTDHPLRFEWVFWVLHRSPSKKMSEEEFGRAMRRLGSCDTVETFYPLYLHLKRPSVQTPIADLHLFSHPIKPVWEDPSNVKGGKWTIRLRKGLSDRLWESLVLSLIGGGLEKLVGSGDGQEICGAVLSVRRDEDIMAVWHRSGDADLAGDGKMAKKVKLSLQTILQLPLNCSLAYKLNADSLASGTHHAQKLAQQLNSEAKAQATPTRISQANHHRGGLGRKREIGGESFGLN